MWWAASSEQKSNRARPAGFQPLTAWELAGIVIFDAVLIVIWLMLAVGTRVPALDRQQADGLAARLRALPGVHEARVAGAARCAYLTVDSTGFDEENVPNLNAGEI